MLVVEDPVWPFNDEIYEPTRTLLKWDVSISMKLEKKMQTIKKWKLEGGMV